MEVHSSEHMLHVLLTQPGQPITRLIVRSNKNTTRGPQTPPSPRSPHPQSMHSFFTLCRREATQLTQSQCFLRLVFALLQVSEQGWRRSRASASAWLCRSQRQRRSVSSGTLLLRGRWNERLRTENLFDARRHIQTFYQQPRQFLFSLSSSSHASASPSLSLRCCLPALTL
jgi:hypothetical protein